MIVLLAHAGHWVGTVAFAVPALLVGAGVALLALRERLGSR